MAIAGLGGPISVYWASLNTTFAGTITGTGHSGGGTNCSKSSSQPNAGSYSQISEIDVPGTPGGTPGVQKYLFSYDSNDGVSHTTFGRISKMTFPGGGYVRYVWGLNSQSTQGNAQYTFVNSGFTTIESCSYNFDTPAITDRYVSYDGQTEVLHQHFSYSTSFYPISNEAFLKNTTVTSTDLLTNQVAIAIYTYGPVSTQTAGWLGGVAPVERSIVYQDGSGHTLKTENKTWYTVRNILGDQTILDNGQGDAKQYCYDLNEQLTNVYEYGFQSEGAKPPDPSCYSTGFGSGSGADGDPGLNNSAIGPLRRQTTTSYQSFASGTHIVNAPNSITVADGSGNTAKQTTFTYTNTVQSSGTSVGLVAPPGTERGNVASVAMLISAGNWATTSYAYFDNGQLQSMTDACGNATCSDVSGTNHTTRYSYTDAFASGTGTATGQTNAYLTLITNPKGQTQSFTLGYNDGLVRSSTDQNGQTTNYQYNDPLLRPTRISYPDTGVTSVAYNDSTYHVDNSVPANNTPNLTTTKIITGSLTIGNLSAFDGLGHSVRSILTTDPDGATTSDTGYDGFGRAANQSNPYRSAFSTTDGTTAYNYDALGRVWNIGEPDGSAKNFQFSRNCKTIWDEASKVRGECYDSLGRLIQVWEDQSGYNYPTFYYYDVLDNLTCVEQTGNVAGTGCSSPPSSDATSPWRVRRFTYDSLSRLLSAHNPESGTIAYSYDANGNVAIKTAPQPNQTGTATVTTNYSYDNLNRLVAKSYVGMSTAGSTYGYDGVAPTGCTPPTLADSYPAGRRTAMCDASGSSSWTHDKMGRVLTESRKVNGFTRNISYAYNLDGSLASLTYPSGRVVSYTPGGAGRPTAVADSVGPINYVQAAHYAPFGGVTDMTQGATPITVKNRYSPRLQPVLLSTYTSSATIMSLCYDFHSGVVLSGSNFAPCSFSASSAGDNGNIYQIVNNRDGNRTQNFMYDSLNRIQQAYTSGPNWGETYSSTATAPGVAPPTSGIDAWGNLTNHVGVTGKTNTEGTFGCPAGINNQLTACGLNYDAAGNVMSNNGVSYTYDAENRLVTPGTGNGTYYYDGDGNRMARLFSSSGTEYWRDLGGNTLLEDSNTGVNLREYIYFNGQRIARRDVVTNAVHYVFSNHLGSTSIITDALGTMAACNGYTTGQYEADLYPYGGEMSICNNLGDQNYKFSGKERDAESGLDYFGARYNTSTFGRFMTPDSIAYSGLDDPQSLNLYSYVGNHPTIMIDPDGHCWTGFNWVCNTYQRFDNWLTQGEGFRTDQQVNSPAPAKDPRAQRKRQQENKSTLSSQWDRTLHGGEALGPGGRQEIQSWCGGGFRGAVCYDMHAHFGWMSGMGQDPYFRGSRTVDAYLAGVKVYRVWGNKAGPYGRYWTRVDPRTVPNYRDAAGLPNTNSGRFLTRGELNNMEGVNETTAVGLDGNAGGLDELQVQNPEGQVTDMYIEVLPPGGEF